MSRLVVVSNRLADPGKPAADGFTVALGDVLKRTGGFWFGGSGKLIHGGQPGQGEVYMQQAGSVTLAGLDLCSSDACCRGYASQVLWPAFHYRLDLAHFDPEHLCAYQRVNQLFARKLLPLLKPDDLVWIHGHHLIPLAQELRELGCTQRIGWFLHIPLPPPQMLAALPAADWLLRALFAYDLLGFQSAADLAHFAHYANAEAAAESLGAGHFRAFSRRLRAAVFPIGIHVEDCQRLGQARAAREAFANIRSEYSRRRLLIGVGRLDCANGLPQRLCALRELLQRYPEQRHSATLLQLASSEHADAGGEIQREMERLSGAINGEYGDFDWMPVRYLHRNVSRQRLPGWYRASAVALATPLREGMNLQAKEFVLAQDKADPGVLVLSRFSGAAEQLPQALLVNPYDIGATAQAIQRALQMPLAERRQRHAALLQSVSRFDVHWWCRSFLAALVPQP